jgi:hypothetical protein
LHKELITGAEDTTAGSHEHSGDRPSFAIGNDPSVILFAINC